MDYHVYGTEPAAMPPIDPNESCPRCGGPVVQKGWCSTDPLSATDWVECTRCGYERRSDGRETVIRKPKRW